MIDAYIEKLDKEIALWVEKRNQLPNKAISFDPTDMLQFKMREKQTFSLELINGMLSGLIGAKALYYKTKK